MTTRTDMDDVQPGAPPRDPWLPLAARTPARIALGRTGPALPTRAVLELALAHARARDAVHGEMTRDVLERSVTGLGLTALDADSEATGRALYLRRPDYGRRLSAASRSAVAAAAFGAPDVALVIGDGLSAAAVDAHAPALLAHLVSRLRAAGLSLAPVTIVRGARVAIGDEIGALLKARAVAVLIGERPGLSAPDSLGVYLTYEPRPGRTDAERNCVSNIRTEGLTPALAAARLAWLIGEALRRGVTGVGLKDDSAAVLGRRDEPPGLAAGGRLDA